MAKSGTLSHKDFIQKVLPQYIMGSPSSNQAKNRGELEVTTPYGKVRELMLCPEPLEFIADLNEAGNDKEQCRVLFQNKLQSFQRVQLPERFAFWWNTSSDQINLRFGVKEGAGDPVAVPLGDLTVHGLIAGQTGSGKSVLLHNLIFNLMAEYPPWELDLYLADFKRVEFSRYMEVNRATGRYPAPHVVACAATGEIRYVLSLIQHVVDCMNAREDFFKRMGYEKIRKFRDAYPQLVLPRILLIVDEFQQMFLEASTRESEHIRRMLTAIVKKGRATGVHIIFASQEMSQTLSRSDLANFRMRAALNCDPNVSLDVLGNRAAAECELGYVYVNRADYSENTNEKFHVPYVETDEKDGQSYFDVFLTGMCQMATHMNFQKNTKFYQEDFQEPIEELEMILDQIDDYRKGVRTQYFDALVLGRYVTFSSQKYDIQTLFLERGRNRNILALSPNTDDLAYLQKLFALNFAKSGFRLPQEAYHHKIYSFMGPVENLYALDEDLSNLSHGAQSVEVIRNPEEFNKLEQQFTRMRFLLPLYKESSTPLQFILLNYQKNIERELRRRPDLRKEREGCIPVITERFQGITLENGLEMCERIRAEEGRTIIGKLAENAMEYCRYHQDPLLAFPSTVIWISGIDLIERLPDWLLWMMKNGMDYNLLFICMSGTEFDTMTQLAKYCDYLFLGGTNRRIYDRLSVNFTAKSPDSIALDMVIRSTGEERSFKKYRCSFGTHESARIPFDHLLM